MDFSDKVVVITGGSSGIGLATARLLAARRARVWLLARDESRLTQALDGVRAACPGPDSGCGALVADVADPAQVGRAVDRISEQAGSPDLVINSAGVVYPGYFQDLELDRFREMMDINFFGTVHVCKAVIPAMISRRSGHIVNVSSLAGVVGAFGYTGYSASKFAVSGFSNALRLEMKPFGIHVSAVFPPDTDTPQLAFDNAHKPIEARGMNASVKTIPADTVARSILAGVAAGRYVITPSLDSRLAFWMSGPGGAGVNTLQDLMLAHARRPHRREG